MAFSVTTPFWWLIALCSHAVWGGFPPINRFLQKICLLPGIGIFMIVGCYKKTNKFYTLYSNRWALAFLFAGVVRAVCNICAAKFCLAVYIQLISLLSPFLAAFLSRAVDKKPLPRYTVLCCCLSTAFSLLVLFGPNLQGLTAFAFTTNDLIGMCLAIVANIGHACTFLFVTKFKQIGPEVTHTALSFTMAVVTTPLSPIIGESWRGWLTINVAGWLAFALFTVMCLLGIYLQVAAIRVLGGPNVATLQPLTLAFTVIFAWLALGEAIASYWQWIGLFGVGFSLGFFLFIQARDWKAAQRAAAARAAPVAAAPAIFASATPPDAADKGAAKALEMLPYSTLLEGQTAADGTGPAATAAQAPPEPSESVRRLLAMAPYQGPPDVVAPAVPDFVVIHSPPVRIVDLTGATVPTTPAELAVGATPIECGVPTSSRPKFAEALVAVSSVSSPVPTVSHINQPSTLPAPVAVMAPVRIPSPTAPSSALAQGHLSDAAATPTHAPTPMTTPATLSPPSSPRQPPCVNPVLEAPALENAARAAVTETAAAQVVSVAEAIATEEVAISDFAVAAPDVSGAAGLGTEALDKISAAGVTTSNVAFTGVGTAEAAISVAGIPVPDTTDPVSSGARPVDGAAAVGDVPTLAAEPGAAMRVLVDEGCIGCQACVAEAPQLFALKPDTNQVTFIGQLPLSATDLDICHKVAAACLQGSIHVAQQ